MVCFVWCALYFARPIGRIVKNIRIYKRDPCHLFFQNNVHMVPTDITVLSPVDIVSVCLHVILLTDVVAMDVTLDGSQQLIVIRVGSIL